MLRKYFFCLLTLVFTTSGYAACCSPGIFSGGLFCPENYWEVGIGYRKDKIKWKVDFPKGRDLLKEDEIFVEVDPNLRKAKLRLEDQDLFVVSVRGQIPVGVAYIRGYMDYGWVRDGKAPERLERLTQCLNISNKFKGSHAFDTLVGMGYPVYYLRDALRISPICGFSYHKQRIRTSNGDRFFNIPNIEEENFCRVRTRNKYHFRWWGPWAGIDFVYSLFPNVALYDEVEYHISRAGRCKRLRDTRVGVLFLRRRSDRERAHGFNNRLGITWTYFCSAYVDLNWYFQHWSSGGRKEKVQWCSNSLLLNFGQLF